MTLTLTLLFACQTSGPEPATLIEMSCSDGDPEACFRLGTKELTSARPDYTEARRLFSTACATHHAQACNTLGTLVRDARGGPKDPRRAAELFELACEKGLQQGCVHFADALRSGQGTEADPERAKQLYRDACDGEASVPRACSELALSLRDEKGARREQKEEAEQYFRKACEAGYPEACAELAHDLTKAWGKDNMANAVELYERACMLDPNHGCFELAQLHQSGKAPEANKEQAAHFFQQVCRIDSSRGCYELAEMMDRDEVPSRPGEKQALYKQACESGNSDACTKR